MSRIAIDIRPLLDRHLTEAGFSLLETLQEILPHASPTREYILFASGNSDALARIPDFPKNPYVTIVKREIPHTILALFSLFSRRALDILLDAHCDAWWLPYWTIPSTKKPFALTIHDINFIHTPHAYSWGKRFFFALIQAKRSARRAQICIAPSSLVAEDVRRAWHINPSRIFTIPPGVRHDIFSPREHPSDKSFRASYDLNRPYILLFTPHHLRENITGILAGYAHAQKILPTLPVLVFLASKHTHLQNTSLLHIEYAPSKHYAALLRGATALILPSFCETFYFPTLEALACGTQILAPTTTAPTIFFTKGIIPIDPYNVSALSTGILEACATQTTPLFRESLAEQTHSFSWKNHAELLLHAFQRLC